MTIWILALLLLASSIALGHKLGAIRASFSFVGIVFASSLAVLIGKLLKPLLPHVGIHNTTLIWMIAPIEAFVLVLILFKVAGFFVHRKVNVYYKYKAGDLRLALWERLNTRLGACVGALNGAAYLVLICFVIFNFTYWTVQAASSDNETKTTQFINRLGNDLQDTGMAKVAHAAAPLPANFYKMADLAGLILQNPDLSDRLAHYPAFLSLYERDDLQQLTQNSDFANAWSQHVPAGQLLNEPAVKSILQDKDLINTVWTLLQTNMDDLTVYLKTGKSPKYDSEKILGRWDFNVSVTVAMVRQARPNIPASEMRAVRATWSQAFADTVFVAGGDGQAFLKNLPNFKNQPPAPETWTGSWTVSDETATNGSVTLSENGEDKPMTFQTDGTRLTLKDPKSIYIFDRED
ncbi:MAG TPA: CvpA family protein [Verrucomicrobiae bacterium]